MTLKFKLEVYSHEVKLFLVSQDNRGLEIFLTESRVLGKNHEEMVEEGWINSEWLEFIVWYNKKEWLFLRKKLLFRGIEEYTWSTLRSIIKTGNDRVGDTSVVLPEGIKGYTDLAPSQFIWGGDLPIAWFKATNKLGSRDGKRLLLIYNERLLEDFETSSYSFKLKKGVSSFKEALFAIVIINYC